MGGRRQRSGGETPMETLVGTRMKKCRAAGPGGLDGPGQGAGHYPAGNGERQALKRGGRGNQSVLRALWLCVCSGLRQGTRAGAVSKWVGGGGAALRVAGPAEKGGTVVPHGAWGSHGPGAEGG